MVRDKTVDECCAGKKAGTHADSLSSSRSNDAGAAETTCSAAIA